MKRKAKVDIDKFNVLYTDFISIQTWTKEKHQRFESLMDYLKNKESVKITTGSSTTATRSFPFRSLHEFDIYEVPSKKTGSLMQYRGKRVLRIFTSRYRFNKTIMCFPIKEKRTVIKNPILEALSKISQPQTLENYLSLAGIDLPLDNEQKAILIGDFPQWKRQIEKL